MSSVLFLETSRLGQIIIFSYFVLSNMDNSDNTGSIISIIVVCCMCKLQEANTLDFTFQRKQVELIDLTIKKNDWSWTTEVCAEPNDACLSRHDLKAFQNASEMQAGTSLLSLLI